MDDALTSILVTVDRAARVLGIGRQIVLHDDRCGQLPNV